MTRAPMRRTVLIGCTTALCGCSVLPEESEPIEASANTPAILPESTGYSPVVEAAPTIETAIRVDFSGDVELTSQRDVIATVFQRVYEGPDGRRFGLLTAPAVTVVENPEVVRDPVTALDEARVVELATDQSVGAVEEWTRNGTTTLLSSDTEQTVTTAALDGEDARLVRARVRAGDDSVTAIAATPDGTGPPFGAVVRDA